MFIRPVVLLVASLFAPLAMSGQQSLNPQPAPVQSQTSPCVTIATASQKQSASSVGVKPPTKWQQYLDAQKKEFAIKYGIILPDVPAQIPIIPKASGQPCQSQMLTAVPAASALKLPPDTSVTLHCNPMTPSSKDAAHPTTLTLPDPHDFGIPKLSDFLADSVVPDMAAKTPCYLIKVDPKTQKSFVQQ